MGVQPTLYIVIHPSVSLYLVYFILVPVVAKKPPFSFNMQLEEIHITSGKGTKALSQFRPRFAQSYFFLFRTTRLEAAGFIVGIICHNLALFSGGFGSFLVVIVVSTAAATVLSLP